MFVLGRSEGEICGGTKGAKSGIYVGLRYLGWKGDQWPIRPTLPPNLGNRGHIREDNHAVSLDVYRSNLSSTGNQHPTALTSYISHPTGIPCHMYFML